MSRLSNPVCSGLHIMELLSCNMLHESLFHTLYCDIQGGGAKFTKVLWTPKTCLLNMNDRTHQKRFWTQQDNTKKKILLFNMSKSSTALCNKILRHLNPLFHDGSLEWVNVGVGSLVGLYSAHRNAGSWHTHLLFKYLYSFPSKLEKDKWPRQKLFKFCILLCRTSSSCMCVLLVLYIIFVIINLEFKVCIRSLSFYKVFDSPFHKWSVQLLSLFFECQRKKSSSCHLSSQSLCTY